MGCKTKFSNNKCIRCPHCVDICPNIFFPCWDSMGLVNCGVSEIALVLKHGVSGRSFVGSSLWCSFGHQGGLVELPSGVPKWRRSPAFIHSSYGRLLLSSSNCGSMHCFISCLSPPHAKQRPTICSYLNVTRQHSPSRFTTGPLRWRGRFGCTSS